MPASRDDVRKKHQIASARRGLYRLLLSALALSGVGLAANCGGGGDDDGANGAGPCDTVYKGLCGSPCDETNNRCPAGLFCSANQCTAQCSPQGGCGEGQTCSTSGRCVGNGAGGGGIGGNVGTGGSGGSGGGQGGQGGQCPDLAVQFTPVVPLITVLIDKSGSMKCAIDSAQDGCDNNDQNAPNTRWRVLKEALLDDTGVLKTLESKAYFGLNFYSEVNNGCPSELETLGAALNNYDEIKTFYDDAPFDPAAGTPTGSSLQRTIDAIAESDVAPADTPRYVVLCTDGIPDTCSNGDDTDNGKKESVEAAKAGFKKNVKTFVVGIGGFIDTDEGEAHFQQVADAGVGFGQPGGSAAAGKYYLAKSQAELVSAFNEVILGARSCSFDLSATITAEAAPKGKVTVDAQEKVFNDVDGWKLVDSDTIEFVGAACKQIREGATNVKADFPCGTGGVVPKPPR